MPETLLLSTDAAGLAVVTLNRPAMRNVFDDHLIAALTETFQAIDADPAVRVVVLRGAGSCFSAGGDLNWMRRMAAFDAAENRADAGRLAAMFAAFDRLSKPTIAAVHGLCFAGGIGLVGAADIAVATEDAVFCLSEVRVGLVPATIGPYVIRAMGARAARRLALTAERFSAAEALRLGLVHAVVPAIEAALPDLVSALLQGSPAAQARTKALFAAVTGRPIDADVTDLTIEAIAEARASAEARAGLAAFFEKRKPGWRP